MAFVLISLGSALKPAHNMQSGQVSDGMPWCRRLRTPQSAFRAWRGHNRNGSAGAGHKFVERERAVGCCGPAGVFHPACAVGQSDDPRDDLVNDARAGEDAGGGGHRAVSPFLRFASSLSFNSRQVLIKILLATSSSS